MKKLSYFCSLLHALFLLIQFQFCVYVNIKDFIGRLILFEARESSFVKNFADFLVMQPNKRLPAITVVYTITQAPTSQVALAMYQNLFTAGRRQCAFRFVEWLAMYGCGCKGWGSSKYKMVSELCCI